MTDRVVGWLVNTCLLGLIPALARIFVWNASRNGVEAVTISDLVAFGLVVHSYSINEVSRSTSLKGEWKTINIGISILFLVFFVLVLFTTINPPANIDLESLRKSTFLLAGASFVSGTFVTVATSKEQAKASA